MASRPLEGFESTYARALYRAAGHDARHFGGPLVGIINSYSTANPGHAHLDGVSRVVREAVTAAGGMPVEFGVPAPCDGIAQGPGMHYILPMREAIAAELRQVGGMYRAADEEARLLDAESRAELEAYAAGVNACIEGQPLPAEFVLLRYQPEPWRPVHSLYWPKMVAWGLSINWETELLRARLIETLGEERAAELYGTGAIRGFMHLYNGEEAIAVGAIAAMTEKDHLVTHYRDHGYALAVGADPGKIMAELFGRAGGHHAAALVAAFRAHVDDVISVAQYIHVMFDDQHAVAGVGQSSQHFN